MNSRQALRAATLVLTLGLATACGGTRYVHVGPNWAAAHELEASKDGFEVRARVPDAAKVGTKVQLEVESARSGQLWVMQVDAADEATLVYPNDAEAEHAISAETPLVLPAADASWSFEVVEPLGASLFVFIVTEPGTSLEEVLETARTPDGSKAALPKALRVVETAPDGRWGLDKVMMEVEDAH